MITPILDKILIRRDEKETKTKSGIIFQEKNVEDSCQGTVLSVGGGSMDKNGKLVKSSVQEGNRVIFGPYSGSDIEENLLIMREEDILAVVI